MIPDLAFRLLLCVHGGIKPARFEQLFRRAGLDQPAFIEDQNPGGAAERSKSVADKDGARGFILVDG